MDNNSDLSLALSRLNTLSEEMVHLVEAEDWSGFEKSSLAREKILRNLSKVEIAEADALETREILEKIKRTDKKLSALIEESKSKTQQELVKSRDSKKAVNSYQNHL